MGHPHPCPGIRGPVHFLRKRRTWPSPTFPTPCQGPVGRTTRAELTPRGPPPPGEGGVAHSPGAPEGLGWPSLPWPRAGPELALCCPGSPSAALTEPRPERSRLWAAPQAYSGASFKPGNEVHRLGVPACRGETCLDGGPAAWESQRPGNAESHFVPPSLPRL